MLQIIENVKYFTVFKFFIYTTNNKIEFFSLFSYWKYAAMTLSFFSNSLGEIKLVQSSNLASKLTFKHKISKLFFIDLNPHYYSDSIRLLKKFLSDFIMLIQKFICLITSKNIYLLLKYLLKFIKLFIYYSYLFIFYYRYIFILF